MYMQFFTPTIISVATIIGFLCGTIWFSPLLFMKALFIGEGVKQNELPKRSKLYIIQTHLYSLIAHGVIASVLALLLELLQVTSLKVALSVSVLLCIGFIVSKNFLDMIYSLHEEHWRKRVQIKFLVNSGYYIFVMCVMATVMFFLSHN